MKKQQHDVRIDRSELHPWLDYKLGLLLDECAKKGFYLIITEGHRTKEYQDQLYAKGRDAKGNVIGRTVTNAKGSDNSSQHQWGIAFDIAMNYDVDGDGKVSDDTWNSKGFSKVAAIAKSIKVGLKWGGDWKGLVDTPHFYLGKWGSTTKKLKSKYGTPEKFRKYWKRTLKKKRYLYATKTLKVGGKKKCLIRAGEEVTVLWYSKLGYAKVKYDGKIGYVYRSGFSKVK